MGFPSVKRNNKPGQYTCRIGVLPGVAVLWCLLFVLNTKSFMHLERTKSLFQVLSSAGDPQVVNITCEIHFTYESMSLCHFVPYKSFGGNFGDMLGPAVIQRALQQHFEVCDPSTVSTRDVVEHGHGGGKCLFSVGSVMHQTRPGDAVWGTGINPYRQAKLKRTIPKQIDFYSVRGPQSLAYLRHNSSYSSIDVPAGDPGYLIPFLFPEYMPPPAPTTNVQFCFVPHAHDRNQGIQHDDITLVSVSQPWRTVLQTLLHNCTHVASSSLHGIVVADAMGLSTMWFQWKGSETATSEGTFKYLDYLQSIGRVQGLVPISNVKHLKKTSIYFAPLKLETRRAIAGRTLSSFPFHLFEKKEQGGN